MGRGFERRREGNETVTKEAARLEAKNKKKKTEVVPARDELVMQKGDKMTGVRRHQENPAYQGGRAYPSAPSIGSFFGGRPIRKARKELTLNQPLTKPLAS